MNCRTCGYTLWNLTSPRCPECGSGFDLRDYRFQQGTVTFACPKCDHEHEGRGPQHIPSQREWMTCGGCGESVRVSDLRIRLRPDLDPGKVVVYPASLVPWELSDDLGSVRAWWQTCVLAMRRPHRLADLVHADATEWRAVTFLNMTLAVIPLPHILLALATAAGGEAFGLALLACLALVPVTMFLAIYLSLFVVMLFVTVSLAVHGGVRLLGGTAPFRTTVQCTLYGQAPMILAAAPFIGLLLIPIWQLWALWSTSRMIARCHRMSPTAAVFASFWIPAGIMGIWGVFGLLLV